MSTQTPVPYPVWKDGLEKWDHACQLTTFWSAWDWWYREGTAACSFCDYYRSSTSPLNCGACPLRVSPNEGTCAPEWDAVHEAFMSLAPANLTRTARAELEQAALSTFRKNALALRARIEALPHTEPRKKGT